MDFVQRKIEELQHDEMQLKNKISNISSSLETLKKDSRPYKALEVKKFKAEIKLYEIFKKLKGYNV